MQPWQLQTCRQRHERFSAGLHWQEKQEILQHRARRAPTSRNHREILDYVETEDTEPSYIKRSVKTCILNFFCLSEVNWWKTFHGIIFLILSFAQQCFAHILMTLTLFMSVWFKNIFCLGSAWTVLWDEICSALDVHVSRFV